MMSMHIQRTYDGKVSGETCKGEGKQDRERKEIMQGYSLDYVFSMEQCYLTLRIRLFCFKMS